MPIAPIDQKNGEPRAKKLPRKKGVKKRQILSGSLPTNTKQAGDATAAGLPGREFRTGLPVTNESLPDDCCNSPATKHGSHKTRPTRPA